MLLLSVKRSIKNLNWWTGMTANWNYKTEQLKEKSSLYDENLWPELQSCEKKGVYTVREWEEGRKEK